MPVRSAAGQAYGGTNEILCMLRNAAQCAQVGGRDCLEGLQDAAQMFVDHSIAAYDQVQKLHTVSDAAAAAASAAAASDGNV